MLACMRAIAFRPHVSLASLLILASCVKIQRFAEKEFELRKMQDVEWDLLRSSRNKLSLIRTSSKISTLLTTINWFSAGREIFSYACSAGLWSASFLPQQRQRRSLSSCSQTISRKSEATSVLTLVRLHQLSLKQNDETGWVKTRFLTRTFVGCVWLARSFSSQRVIWKRRIRITKISNRSFV